MLARPTPAPRCREVVLDLLSGDGTALRCQAFDDRGPGGPPPVARPRQDRSWRGRPSRLGGAWSSKSFERSAIDAHQRDWPDRSALSLSIRERAADPERRGDR